ncbi:MAG: hypothetical protein M3Z33_05525 [Actinomycetota bacterium]|nr:hypothetical protein [Actinomycetota bacterium]
MALAKSLYAIPTWTRTVRLVREHAALRAAVGGNVPSEWACYRFTRKLRGHSDTLARCLDRVTGALHAKNPGMGANVAIDGRTFPPTPTASGSSRRTGRSASGSPILTRVGGTVPLSPLARAVGSTATRSAALFAS